MIKDTAWQQKYIRESWANDRTLVSRLPTDNIDLRHEGTWPPASASHRAVSVSIHGRCYLADVTWLTQPYLV